MVIPRRLSVGIALMNGAIRLEEQSAQVHVVSQKTAFFPAVLCPAVTSRAADSTITSRPAHRCAATETRRADIPSYNRHLGARSDRDAHLVKWRRPRPAPASSMRTSVARTNYTQTSPFFGSGSDLSRRRGCRLQRTATLGSMPEHLALYLAD